MIKCLVMGSPSPPRCLAAALPIPSPAIASQELRPSNDLAVQSANSLPPASLVAGTRVNPMCHSRMAVGSAASALALAAKSRGGSPWACRHER